MKKYLLALPIFLAACQPITLPTVNTFTFQTAKFNNYTTQHTNKVLLISTPSAAPGYKTNKIAYSQRPYEIKYFTRNEWVDPPAQMLLPLMSEAINRSNHYRAVVSEPYTGLADLRLDSQIVALKQQFDHNQNSVMIVELNIQLIDLHSNKVIFGHTFDVQEPIRQKQIYAAITATNVALEKLLDDVVTTLNRNA